MVGEIFKRFVQESPIAVMVRATLENAFAAVELDQLFTQTAEQQYTRTLLFSTVVDLMTTVVLRQEKSIHAAFQQRREQLGVGISSLYEKLERMETKVSEALVRHSVARVEPVLKELEPTPEELLPGYEVRILDGHHLEGTEPRLKPLRRTRAGALPGQSLVALDPQRKLLRHVHCCEDGHRQERALVDAALAWVEPGQVGVADRNFATTRWIFGVMAGGGHVVVREHASTLHWVAAGPVRAGGRSATGSLSEQELQIADEQGEGLRLRRIMLRLDRPTRDGDHVIVVLTTLPAEVAAVAVVERYRKRWRIGVSREGSLTQSVQVRPRLTDSGLVAWEAPGRESKLVKPSDTTLGKESLQRSRLQRAVNAEVASSHATPVAETVDNVRRQQGPSEKSLRRRSSPAGYQRRHGTKGERATGEVRGVRRRKLAGEAWPITVSGKWLGWPPDGGSGRSTDNPRAAKRAGREGPGPVGNLLSKERQG